MNELKATQNKTDNTNNNNDDNNKRRVHNKKWIDSLKLVIFRSQNGITRLPNQ